MGDWIGTTPGFYNAGRFVGVDDPDKLPTGELDLMLSRDGLLGMRMISPEQAGRYFPALEHKGCRIDRWDIFVGDPARAGVLASKITEGPIPAPLTIHSRLTGAETVRTKSLQEFLASNGLAPFPGALLVAEPPEGLTIVLGTGDEIVACGHTYFPHNSYSPFYRHAWIGLIAVDKKWRGQLLGRLVNALLVQAAFETLGAHYVYEMVAPTNLPSRRMVESCGLGFDPSVLCGVAVPQAAERFTR